MNYGVSMVVPVGQPHNFRDNLHMKKTRPCAGKYTSDGFGLVSVRGFPDDCSRFLRVLR